MDKRLSPVILCVLALMVFVLPASVLAASPPNDNFANAMVIPGLPFSDSVDVTEATTEPGEPQFCFFSERTVWYSFTPAANGVFRADTSGSSFSDTHLNVYQALGPGLGGLDVLGCASFGSAVSFRAQAGVTYYIQAGGIFGSSGVLLVNLQEVPPPANDNFADAVTIGSIPFDHTVDTSAATREIDEPIPSCLPFATQGETVWYAITPTVSESVSAFIDNTPFSTVIALYTGDSLGNLAELSCRNLGGVFTNHLDPGTTYYFQVTILFTPGGFLRFNLISTPPPVASFAFFPSDPSVFDTVQFSDSTHDPGDVGVQSQAWNLGDGVTTTGCCPTHQYAADGDYTVQLTVTTVDGRTASTSQVVQVRTHDVAITKFTVPKSASAGQTRQISVGVNSKRLPENVEVRLFKSVPGGFQEVGVLTQSVPVRPSNRTTQFDFSYTFTNDDANVGKVTFKAVATIVGARDALPADNEAIASPTKVNR